MFDAYAAVRAEIALLLARAGFVATQADISTRSHNYEASCAIALAQGIDANALHVATMAENEKLPAQIFGVELINTIDVQGGHLCFSLTDNAFTMLLRKAVNGLNALPLEDAKAQNEYVYMRMRMLARKEGKGVPENKNVQRALWLGLGIVEALSDAKLLNQRLNECADAALHMFDAERAQAREVLAAQSAEAASCIAAMLYLGIARSNSKNAQNVLCQHNQ